MISHLIQLQKMIGTRWEIAKLVERRRLQLYDVSLLTADSKLVAYPHVKIER